MLTIKTPGFLKEFLFYLRILTIILVLSISLQIHKTIENILVENTSGHLEHQREKNVK
jgi:hypothetical protein